MAESKRHSILRRPSSRTLARIIFFVVIFAWPLLYHSNYALSNMVSSGLFAVLALGVGLIMGQAGQMSFGHPAFAGIGAYSVAILTTKLNWSPVLALLVGVVASGVVAYVVGRPVLRFKLYFLALATIGLTSIFYVVALQARSVTGGANGISAIPWLSVAGHALNGFLSQYYIMWVVVLLVFLFAEAAVRSRVGRALRALAVNEVAASTLGINTSEWKLRVFVVGSTFCGLAGGLWALFLSSAAPTDFTFTMAITVIIMVMVGGAGSLLGVMVGAILITWLGFSMSSFQTYSTGIYALILILLILFLPGGLAGIGATIRGGRLRVLAGGFDKLMSRVGLQTRAVAVNAVGGLEGKKIGDSEASARTDETPSAASASVDASVGGGAAAGMQTDAPARGPVLKLDNITVDFGGLQAVSHVSFEVLPGQITAVIGPNGAGKTTLFNVVNGLQKASTGHVWFAGKDVTGLAPAQVARLGMARTFQNLRIFGNMSVLENVMVGRHRHEKSKFVAAGLRLRSQRREEVSSQEASLRVLKLVGLEERAHSMASSLPYGQQRLVEIARALATEPSLLLLDEPAAGMNNAEREMLVEKIVHINKSGTDILLVEHDMDLVMGISHHVAVLDHGALICDATPEEARCDPAVVQAYLGVGHADERRAQERAAKSASTTRLAGSAKKLLEIRGLSTYYGSIGAVRDVSLHVEEGEVLAVLGANGGGKTTLLHTISGSLKPRSGSIIFDGKAITRLSAPEIVELGVCQVPEGRHVFPTLSVEDNLMLGAGRQYKGAAFQALRAEVFDLFPILAERRKQSAGSLSGGEQQMLAIGRALMGRPRLLLLDEPSMGLAPLVVSDIFDALVRLNEKGISLLMVEQNADAALSIADRACVLVTGQVALTGPAAELREDPRLRGLYLGGGA